MLLIPACPIKRSLLSPYPEAILSRKGRLEMRMILPVLCLVTILTHKGRHEHMHTQACACDGCAIQNRVKDASLSLQPY